MNFQFRNSTSERAIINHLSREGTDMTLAIETGLVEHPGFGNDIRSLNDALTETGESLARTAADRSPSGFDKEAGNLIDRRFKPAFRLAVEGQRRSMAELEKEEAALYAPRFAEGSEPATRAEQRAWWRELSMPQRIEAANDDPALAAAIVEGGPAMAGLPRDIFERLRRNMAIGQLGERIARDANLRTVPTADDPIGGQPDYATARANAAKRLDRLDDERDMLNRVPTLLANVVTAVALMTGETRQAAFERLTA